jgi:hypothetical protein
MIPIIIWRFRDEDGYKPLTFQRLEDGKLIRYGCDRVDIDPSRRLFLRVNDQPQIFPLTR